MWRMPQTLFQPGGLLAMLFEHGAVRQVEVAVTRSIAWLAAAAGGHALDELIRQAGVSVPVAVRWMAEVVADDLSRTDIELIDDHTGIPLAVVEAKIGAQLTERQVATYAHDLLRRRGQQQPPGLLVILVPAHRTPEARMILDSALAETLRSTPSAVRTAVWTYDDVLAALTTALPGSGDLEQLNQLIAAAAAVDVVPLRPDELATCAPAREDDLVRLLDSASNAASAESERTLPGGSHVEPFRWRRYVEVVPDSTFLAVGLLDQTHAGEGRWAGMLVHHRTGRAAEASAALRAHFPERAHAVNGHTFIAFRLSPGISGQTLVDAMRTDLREGLGVLRRALHHDEHAPT
jgi:hypothetical protein